MRVGDLHAVHFDLDVPGTVQDVDARVRIVWLDKDLLEPSITTRARPTSTRAFSSFHTTSHIAVAPFL